MSLDPKGYQQNFKPKTKHLFLAVEPPHSAAVEYSPYFFVEARIDFSDIRTGFSMTATVNKALEIYANNTDLLWTDDMVLEIDAKRIESAQPDYASLRSMPDFINDAVISQMETHFIQYLLRSYKVKLFKNFELNVYSSPGESSAAFIRRCFELFNDSIHQDLDAEHEVFDRRLEQIKERFIYIPDETEQVGIEFQNAFYKLSDRTAELFMNPDPKFVPAARSYLHQNGMQEIEERLIALEWEAQQAVARVMACYKNKSELIDEYIIRPNLKGIHIVRSGILWLPAKAE